MPKVALYGLHLLANIFLISAFDRSVLPLFYRFSAKRSAGILIVFTAIFIVLRQIYKNGKCSQVSKSVFIDRHSVRAVQDNHSSVLASF